MRREGAWWAGRRTDLPWEFGLGWGAAAAFVVTTGLSVFKVGVVVGLLVLVSVPALTGAFSGFGCGVLVAGVCELALIGVVEVGAGRLLFRPADLTQLSLLIASAAAGSFLGSRGEERRDPQGENEPIVTHGPSHLPAQIDRRRRTNARGSHIKASS